tara:strand:- start:358 stop:999 length:642 start_codon:yes stop_codon:yes gene_type:complete
MNKLNQYILFLIFCFFITGCEKSPEEVFSKAEEAFNTGNYRQALKGFSQIVSTHENWDRKNEAQEFVDNFPGKLYSHAEILKNEKKLKASIKALNYIVKNYADLEIAPRSQYLIGDIFMNDLKDFNEAITHYKNVVTKFSESRDEPHAQFMIGFIYANPQYGDIQDLEKAKASYEKFLYKYPDHELVPSVKFELENLGKDINDISILKHISTQ